MVDMPNEVNSPERLGDNAAVIQSRYGPARDVLKLATAYSIALPLPKQVRIEVHAASVNPIDWQTMEGNRRLLQRRHFPFVPLFDIAGIVTAVGSEVTRFQVGDAVHTDNKEHGGGAGTFVNVDEDLVSLKPSSMSFVEATAIPLAGQTALLAMDLAKIGAGTRVAILGASGGVGSLAVQIAKARGAYVIGVCSSRNADFVRSLGADEVIPYERIALAHAVPVQSLEAVLDCVGGREQWLAAKVILRDGGRFVTISRDEDGRVTPISALRMVFVILARQFASKFRRRIHYVPVFLDASHRLLDRVDTLVNAGKLHVPVASVDSFNLGNVILALEASKARGRRVGKLVIQVKP